MTPHSFLAILLVGIGLLVDFSVAQQQKVLCADSQGVFLGLATDVDAYSTIQGVRGDKENANDGDNDPQNWVLTKEDNADSHTGKAPTGPQHSYAGKYLQVLPDSGRSYPGRGEHPQHAKDLDGNSPYVSFLMKVTREGEGIHTLFLRWTGGDTVGGGDSLYVVLYKKERNDKKNLVRGQQTVKPAVVPIDAGMSRFAGCCYDMVSYDYDCGFGFRFQFRWFRWCRVL
jgi:hypothetical protein